MKKLFLSCFLVLCILLCACSKTNPAAPTINPSPSQTPVISNTSSQAPTSQPTVVPTEPNFPEMTPEPKSSSSVINEEDLYTMSEDEIKAKLDALRAKPSNELSADDKYNTSLLDYYLEVTYGDYNTHVPLGSSNYIKYPYNKEIKVDLNGDGKLDKIVVTPTDQGVVLNINGLKYDYNHFGNLAEEFAIIDIDESDKFKEIVISDYGPSSDDTSIFFCFDGKKIVYMNENASNNRPRPKGEDQLYGGNDEIGGEFSYIECGGKGEIVTLQRAALLHTWQYPIRYKLTDGHLLRVQPEIFKVSWKVFTLRELPLYTERDKKSRQITMDKGTVVTFTALDDIEWIQVTLPDGQRGWFWVKNHSNIINGNEEIFGHQVFFGLCYAD